MNRWLTRGVLALFLMGLRVSAVDQAALREVGVAKVDITPDYPVRLAGYAIRQSESEGVTQRLWAKALAFGGDRESPAVLITVDTCGFPASVRDEVVRRLRRERKLDPARLAICATHSHCTPLLSGYLLNLFGAPLAPAEQAHLDRYTREFTDALEHVALQALAERRPARLSRGQGSAGFAANRRTSGGPVDHDLPVLFVTDPDGRLRAILATYACHCTTLGGDFNQVCGDWAGYAEEFLEREHPGTVALVGLGCGGDANPTPRSKLELAQQYGQAIATAVGQVLNSQPVILQGQLICRTKQIELPFDAVPDRAEWERRAPQTNHIGYQARLNLARLGRGEVLPTKLPYLVQTWTFGRDLALVFLPGEVVVDYSLRLKRELDGKRLWVAGYANAVPCYIPSERILQEGGYEGGGAMVYYDLPARLAPGIEERIIKAVHELLPNEFQTAASN